MRKSMKTLLSTVAISAFAGGAIAQTDTTETNETTVPTQGG